MTTNDQTTDQSIRVDGYDPNLIPAETAARIEREQESYKNTPDSRENETDTTAGYTVDKEGLVNNFAIEPEMYVERPAWMGGSSSDESKE